jgi:hypothetical protein
MRPWGAKNILSHVKCPECSLEHAWWTREAWLEEPDKGVIPPPKTGDEGIYTEAPNPDAGHEEEVIPPPGTPGGDPNVEPR